MRHSIATMALAGSLRQKLEATAAADFDAIELFENDLIQCPQSSQQVRQMADDLGIALDLYQPLRDFEGVSPAQLQRNLARAERKFDVMQALGIPMLLVCSNALPDAIGNPDLIAEQLRELAERASARGLKVAFEALSWGTHTNRYAQAWAAVERADHPSLGLVLDSYHSLALRDDVSAIAELPGERIFFLQLSDSPWDSSSPPLFTRPLRTFPGLGQFDMVGFVDAVLRTGYNGPLSLEIFNDEFRGAPATLTARGAKSSLIWLEERLHEHATARADQALATKLQAPRPEAEAQHIAFIELSGAADRMPDVQEKLALIGCQSDGADGNQEACIRVQPGSGEFHVSTIGLAATDPRSAALRARFLGCKVSETAGTCELPDGSQVQMVQSGQAKQAGNPPRIESICRAVPVAEFDAWSSLSRGLLGDAQSFGFLKHAPSGVIRGRSLRGAEATFELETTRHAETQVAEAATRRRITRITLAVSNLATTLATLRAAGILALELPEHYYGDLDARFLPAPDLLAELREQRMLYDRQGTGELFQALVPIDSGGLCLQLLERKGGYPTGATDAANAYVANAALERWLSGNH